MFGVNNQLDKLRTCIVGKAHHYSIYNITDPLRLIAYETNEDLDRISKLIKSFGVNVLRPMDIRHNLTPAITPRDYFGMIGDKLFDETYNTNWNYLRSNSWPTNAPTNKYDWDNINNSIITELKDFGVNNYRDLHKYEYANLKYIVDKISDTNKIIKDTKIDTAMISRIGKKLIVGTWPTFDYPSLVRKHFPDHEIHVVESNGHLDGCISVVNDELIISRNDIKCDIPGFETYYIERTPHTGNIETVFDVNMLVIDRKNILCLAENDNLFKKFSEYGITPHIAKFRHNEFWDAGLHCLTSDLYRYEETQKQTIT